jgi:hypothetical protein
MGLDRVVVARFNDMFSLFQSLVAVRSLLRLFLDDGGGPAHARTPPFQRGNVLGADNVLATGNPLPTAGISDCQGSLGHQRSGFASRDAISIETNIIRRAENNRPRTLACSPQPSHFARKHSPTLHVK